MESIKGTSKTKSWFTYTFLFISIFLFLYAIVTLFTQPYDHITWFSVLSKGCLGIVTGIVYLVLSKQQSTNVAKWSKRLVKAGISLVVLFLILIVSIYVIFSFDL